MKIYVFEVENWAREPFRALTERHEVVFDPEPLTLEGVDRYADAEVVSTFIYSELGRPVLERLPKWRFIPSRSTGIDHIDLDACRERGILVSNVPHYSRSQKPSASHGGPPSPLDFVDRLSHRDGYARSSLLASDERRRNVASPQPHTARRRLGLAMLGPGS